MKGLGATRAAWCGGLAALLLAPLTASATAQLSPCPPESNTCIGPIGPGIGAVASFGSPVSPMMTFIYDKLSEDARKQNAPVSAYVSQANAHAAADAAAARALAQTLGLEDGPGLLEGRNADLSVPVSAAPQPALLWARAVGRVGSSERQADAPAMDLTGGAGFVGIDLPYDAATRFGVAAGYSRSTLDTDDAADLDADGYHVSGYVTHAEGPWRLRAIVSYARYDLDSARTIALGREAFATARASYDADNIEALAEVSRVRTFGQLSVEPYLALGLSWLDTGGYTETVPEGVSRDDIVSLQSHSETWPYTILGARFGAQHDVGWAVLAPSLDLGWRHVFGDVSPDLIYSAAELDFAVSGIPIAENSLVVGAGIDALIASTGWRTSVKYMGEIAEKAQLHTFTAGIAVPF